MNKERVLQVADAIEAGSVENLGFNMGMYFDFDHRFHDHTGRNCGTTACIAGWAVALSGGLQDRHYLRAAPGNVSEDAQAWLGISDDEVCDLFLWRPENTGLLSVPVRTAVAVLRNFAETGIVNWEIEA